MEYATTCSEVLQWVVVTAQQPSASCSNRKEIGPSQRQVYSEDIPVYSTGCQCEREERCMGRTCVHWSFSSQCPEQLHSISREIFQRRKTEHSSLCLFLSLLLVYSGERTLPLLLSSHLIWINWWGISPWLLRRTSPYKIDFVYVTFQVLIFILHHDLPLVLL